MHDWLIGRRRGARAAALLAGLAATLGLGAPAGAGAGYSWDPSGAVVRWSEMPAEIGDTRAGMVVTVYGDGRVVVALRVSARAAWRSRWWSPAWLWCGSRSGGSGASGG